MQTPTKIAVAGATGRVGRYVVEALQLLGDIESRVGVGGDEQCRFVEG